MNKKELFSNNFIRIREDYAKLSPFFEVHALNIGVDQKLIYDYIFNHTLDYLELHGCPQYVFEKPSGRKVVPFYLSQYTRERFDRWYASYKELCNKATGHNLKIGEFAELMIYLYYSLLSDEYKKFSPEVSFGISLLEEDMN